MDSTFQHLVLGAFLHDIGKVMQRAEVPLTEGTASLISAAGPTRDGRPTHQHVDWTSQFFEDHLGDVGLEGSASVEHSAQHLSFRHHNPSTPLQEIVAEADRLASGMERGESHYEKNIHKRARLVPLRSLLSLNGRPTGPLFKYPLITLTSRDRTSYPRPDSAMTEWLVPEYKVLWTDFLKDWENRGTTRFEASLALLDALYERHFWCVPANTTEEVPDSSLYEHSRATAAVAACLYEYHLDSGTLQSGPIRDRTQGKFLLVSGDLSGIQNYIFSISHAGGGRVAKRLRARSFLLGRITQILSLQIVTSAGLTFLNILLSAGGKFHVLLPNIQSVRDALSTHEKHCQQWLRDTFQGEVSLNLAFVEMTGSDFVEKRVGEKFLDLSRVLVARKHRSFETLLTGEDGWHEEAFVFPEAINTSESPSGYYDIEGRLSELEEELGRVLPRANVMAIYASDIGRYPVLGWSFSIDPEVEKMPTGAHCLISFLREKELRYSDKRVPVHYEYRATHVPIYSPRSQQAVEEYFNHHADDSVEPGQILPFSAIAQTASGYKSLAYFKADVDRLGLLFRKGLDWSETGWTLSKIATFSRSLEFFFSGRVENLLREKPFDMIYTVFSGGDDVLLIGPWDVVHQFATHLQTEWHEYTGGNPDLTLSAGITISRPMTPVWAAAEEAENALLVAKSQPPKPEDVPKNQLCSFGHLIKWQEIPTIFRDVEQITNWLRGGSFSTSFARNLVAYAELARRYKEKGEVEGLRYLPLLSYGLSRNVKDKEVRQWAESLKDVNGDAIRDLGFVTTYALYFNRR